MLQARRESIEFRKLTMDKIKMFEDIDQHRRSFFFGHCGIDRCGRPTRHAAPARLKERQIAAER